MATSLIELHKEGFVRLENFQAILETKRPLLQAMLQEDLLHPSDWRRTLKRSHAIWRELRASVGMDGFAVHKEADTGDALVSFLHGQALIHERGHREFSAELREQASAGPKQHRPKAATRSQLSQYLSYVNATLVLSAELGTGFHDWRDFEPFYRRKLLTVGRTLVDADRAAKVRELFKVSFPQFDVWDVQRLIRMLRDRRIEDLRRLVDRAVAGEIAFDEEFARDTLLRVLERERATGRARSIASYITLPIGLLPVPALLTTPIQKAVDEFVGKLLSRRGKRDLQWFYLVSQA